jgi:hypothetical protein
MDSFLSVPGAFPMDMDAHLSVDMANANSSRLSELEPHSIERSEESVSSPEDVLHELDLNIVPFAPQSKVRFSGQRFETDLALLERSFATDSTRRTLLTRVLQATWYKDRQVEPLYQSSLAGRCHAWACAAFRAKEGFGLEGFYCSRWKVPIWKY